MAVVSFCLAAAVLLVFGRTVSYGFVNFDDDVYYYSNPHVQGGLSWRSVLWAFTTGYDGIWHPVTWLSHMLDMDLFGPAPAGPHLINILLHATTVILLFRVLWQMTGVLWPSAFVAAVFAVHPLRVETVAWIADRKDLLAGLFFMLMLGAYVRYARAGPTCWPAWMRGSASLPLPADPGKGGSTLDATRSARSYSVALLFFALGLMSKPMLVTAPFLLLLLDWWPLGRFPAGFSGAGFNRLFRLLLEKVPFLLLSAAACVATLLAQPDPLEIVRIERLPFDLRLYNAVSSYVIYLQKMLWPSGLTVFYPYVPEEMVAWKAGLGLVLLAGICCLFFVLRRRRPYLLAGWLWYLGMLAPVIGLTQVAGHARADRYTYLPQIGVYLLAAWVVKDWFPAVRYRRQVLATAAVVVIGTLMGLGFVQTAHWRNSQALWTHALGCTTRNYVAHCNLALELAREGLPAEAIRHLREALDINSHYPEAHMNLGVLLAHEGQPADACVHFQKAIELQPNFPDAFNGLANVLAEQGRAAEAVANYEKAVELRPDFAAAHLNLGNVLATQKRYPEAIDHFNRVLQLRPDDINARNSLKAALALQQQANPGIQKQ